MKTRLLAAALLCCISTAPLALAQTPPAKTDPKKAPAKSPADLAYDAFNKVRGEGGTRDQARFQRVIGAGLDYLGTHATHGRVNDVVNGLAQYANSIDKKQPALVTSYFSLLKLEVTNLKFKDGVSDATKAALAALDAAIADFELRAQFNRENLANLREKLDALNETPGTGRFLVERERSYLHVLAVGTSLANAEGFAKRLLEHKDKGVAGMARAELNILEARKKPFDLKFTGLDGKETDLAQLRGKVVALYFWSSTNKGSLGNIEQLRMLHSDYRKKGFEVVTVCYDKAEDVEKAKAAAKDSKIAFPIHFDGKGNKTEFAAKLGVTDVNRLLIIDQKGMLQATMQGTNLTINLPVNQLEGTIKRLLGVK